LTLLALKKFCNLNLLSGRVSPISLFRPPLLRVPACCAYRPAARTGLLRVPACCAYRPVSARPVSGLSGLPVRSLGALSQVARGSQPGRSGLSVRTLGAINSGLVFPRFKAASPPTPRRH